MKVLATTVALFVSLSVGCTGKKAADDKAAGNTSAMGTAAMSGKDPTAMDTGPAGDMGVKPPSAAVKKATAIIAQIVKTTRAQMKLMEDVQKLADLKKSKDHYVKLTVKVLKLTIEALQIAVTLSDDDLKVYARQARSLNAANLQVAQKMIETQKRILKIQGAKAHFDELQKELTGKLTPLVKQMAQLNQRYAKRARALGLVPATRGPSMGPPIPPPRKPPMK